MKDRKEDEGRPNDGDGVDGWDTCPLVGWESEIRDDWNGFMLRPYYLDKDHRDPDAPLAGNRYTMSATTCRALAKLLLEAAETLENAPLGGSSGRVN